jgi:hypothetical protein
MILLFEVLVSMNFAVTNVCTAVFAKILPRVFTFATIHIINYKTLSSVEEQM